MTYHISAWHNSATEGTHQSKILSAKTMKQALILFARELQKPPRFRSFTSKNKVFMWSNEHGHIMDLPAIEEVTA
jgi:hypothetical protein